MTQSPEGDEEDLLGSAADWLVTLTSGRATDADARALAAWRAQDPRHDEAFRHVANLSSLTRALVDTPPPRAVNRRAVLTGATAVLAVGGLYGLARPPLGLWPSYAELMADHRTGVGERYAFAPSAGVSVEINSKSSVSLAAAGNAIDLIKGEAFVTIQDRSAAFVIRTAGLAASANAAIFNVQAIGGDVGVTCVAGTVRCQRGGEWQMLRPDERLSIPADGRMIRGTTNAVAATAWRHGLLVFEATPLAEVVRQINQYRSGAIVLTNAAIGSRPVNAVLHTEQIDNAVSQIQQLLNLEVRHLPGGVILIS